jgi:hypothetical protein
MRKNNKTISVAAVDNSPTIWAASSRETATSRELELLDSLRGKKRVQKTVLKKIGKKFFERIGACSSRGFIALLFNYPLKLIRSTQLKTCTSAPIATNPC